MNSPRLSPSPVDLDELGWTLSQVSDDELDDFSATDSDGPDDESVQLQATVVRERSTFSSDPVAADVSSNLALDAAPYAPSAWARFEKRILRNPGNLEHLSFRLLTVWVLEQGKPFVLEEWMAATSDAPFPVSQRCALGLGIFHAARRAAHAAGQPAPSPLFLPCLGHLAILLPPGLRWPASLTRGPEFYTNWPLNRTVAPSLFRVLQAATVLASFALTYSLECLERPDFQTNDLPTRLFLSLELVARFVAVVFHSLPDDKPPVSLDRRFWDQLLGKFLARKNLVSPDEPAFSASRAFFEQPVEWTSALVPILELYERTPNQLAVEFDAQ